MSVPTASRAAMEPAPAEHAELHRLNLLLALQVRIHRAAARCQAEEQFAAETCRAFVESGLYCTAELERFADVTDAHGGISQSAGHAPAEQPARECLNLPSPSRGTAIGRLTLTSAHAEQRSGAEARGLEELVADIAFGLEAARARQQPAQSAARLEAGRNLMLQFIKHTPAPVAMLDREMRHIHVSDRWLTDFHLEGRDLTGTYHYEVFPDLPERWKQAHRRALAGAVQKCNDDPYERADGSTEWIDWELHPWRDAAGSIGGIMILCQIVTERKRTQLALERSEARFRTLIESASDMLLVVDRSGVLSYQSPACERILGWRAEELRGRRLFELVHADDAAIARQALTDVETQATPVAWKVRITRKDGSFCLVEAMGRAMPRNEDGREILLNVRDVTESTQRQEQLRQAQKLEALGTLASGIAHDFNNIIAAILSFAEMAKLDTENARSLSDDLDQIIQSARRASGLVRQILAFCRQQTPDRSALSIASTVQEALDLLRATLPATVEITASVQDDLPRVLSNPTDIHQIVMNLCTNAAHAMSSRGRIALSLTHYHLDEGAPPPHAELKPGDYVCLTVTDCGRGMDAATLQRIFDPFFTTKAPGEGTGLGLAVVHGLVREHQGAVTVESKPAQGTSVRVFLAASWSAVGSPRPRTEGIARGSGERVLLVEDEVALARIGRAILSRIGYTPVVFSDPEAAWHAFEAEPDQFAIIVTDYMMPKLTGLDLARRVVTLRPDIPIILTSGLLDQTDLDGAARLGIRAILSKPFEVRALAETLAAAMPGAR